MLALILLVGLVSIGAFAAEKNQPPETTLEKFKVQLAQNIASQLAKQMKVKSTDFSISFENFQTVPSLPQGEMHSLQVLGLGSTGAKRLDGLVQLTVLYNSSSLPPSELQVHGTMKIIGPVLVSKENLVRGRILNERDLEFKVLPWKMFPTGSTGFSKEDFIGRRIRTFVNAGDMVWSGSLDEAFAVRSGDQVELTVFSGPGVIIRSRALARGEARLGEDIRVEQPDTKKIVIGRVVGEKSVEVRF